MKKAHPASIEADQCAQLAHEHGWLWNAPASAVSGQAATPGNEAHRAELDRMTAATPRP